MAVRRGRRKGEVSAVGSLLLSSLSKEQSRMLLLADLATRWEEVVGPNRGGKSSPGSLVDGNLVVTAVSPSCAQDIRMRAGDLVLKIREKWGLDVSSITVRVGKVKKDRHLPGKARKSSVVLPEPESIDECREKIRGVIPREDVEEGLARLMAQYRKRFGGGRAGEDRGENGNGWRKKIR
ncbi:MAG TPA: DUF721 domain-containing protein [Synergistales bacterium]|jgi:hypothetical protein|nr:DUF721 domain-containing protein [Synergistales bacterium]HRV71797.1 DUF721 domain-containing protein [Thermovirgaceae bacterium]